MAAVASFPESRPVHAGFYRLKDFPGSSHRILARWVDNLPARGRVLEIGVGADPFIQIVRRKDLHWTGIDASVASLGAIHRLLAGGLIVDAEDLTRLPGGCDAVILADTLEHLVDPERMLRLAAEALKEGGSIFLSVPNLAHASVRFSLLFGRFQYSDRGILDRTHRTFFTRRSLTEMLERNGLVVVRQEQASVPLPFAMPRLPKQLLELLEGLQRLVIWVLPGVFAYQVLVEARCRPNSEAEAR